MKTHVVFALLLLSLPFAGNAQSSALTTDPPADKANSALMDAFTLPSHGSNINVIAYVASGAGPHPVVLLLHGFPGNERNLDLAQAMRRAGYTVFVSSYRGAWGSHGTFSFANALEDSRAAIAYLRVPANAKRLRIDPEKIVVMGHSMGGWMTLATAAAEPGVRAAITLSGADMAGQATGLATKLGAPAAVKACVKYFTDDGDVLPLATTAEALCNELATHGKQWDFSNYASGLTTRPVFLITSDDGTEPYAAAFANQLRAAGNKDVHESHLATDHPYSDKRIALEQIVLDDLASLHLQ